MHENAYIVTKEKGPNGISLLLLITDLYSSIYPKPLQEVARETLNWAMKTLVETIKKETEKEKKEKGGREEGESVEEGRGGREEESRDKETGNKSTGSMLVSRTTYQTFPICFPEWEYCTSYISARLTNNEIIA